MRELDRIKAGSQKWRDVGFLGVLALLLTASGVAVVKTAYPPRRNHRTSSGEIRAIEPARLKQQLRSGRLSDRKALHWRPVGTPPSTAPVDGGAR